MKVCLLATIFLLAAGCSVSESSSTESSEEETQSDAIEENKDSSNASEEENNENANSDEGMEGEETVRTYLKNELTGPDKELKQALSESNDAVLDYVNEHYKSLFTEDNFETFINKYYVMVWLPYAYDVGYELEPIDIQTEKVEDIENDAYHFEVEVQYSKDGEVGTANVTGRINTNDQGKITVIRFKDNRLEDKLRDN
ncbi:hypothetical protein CEH05_16530 [Halobacillus halophilus]|uniref:Lipoprotein n=1 Tax=Halobacillus halophilus (strain ATCC 35676 / DSM 2266 / JCM 20832 / KCTC 3685 / LMG 17431 / NBRC 102448 / NCIMB 2269) TaxID=866895 RepID=I0JRB7_HALH3|nr:hypothetical protein [Halobacillus halophilus]ASF40671.1 hypothetical protein CEH05_16530 [Halobacillus halophilus]CCG46687.1 hypothetical protein HBHAL_4346 [Halobacillus halophilus DSM 2266]